MDFTIIPAPASQRAQIRPPAIVRRADERRPTGGRTSRGRYSPASAAAWKAIALPTVQRTAVKQTGVMRRRLRTVMGPLALMRSLALVMPLAGALLLGNLGACGPVYQGRRSQPVMAERAAQLSRARRNSAQNRPASSLTERPWLRASAMRFTRALPTMAPSAPQSRT